MNNVMMKEFRKRIVEKGTNDKYTLLPAKKPIDEPLTIQKSMQEIINVKNNTCDHSHEMTVSEFITNNKVCKTCLLSQDSHISDDNNAIYYSLHNTQMI